MVSFEGCAAGHSDQISNCSWHEGLLFRRDFYIVAVAPPVSVSCGVEVKVSPSANLPDEGVEKDQRQM